MKDTNQILIKTLFEPDDTIDVNITFKKFQEVLVEEANLM